jgi:HK97 family phage portal protein
MFPNATDNKINSNDDALRKSYWIYRAITSVSQRAASVPWQIVDSKSQRNLDAEQKLINCNPDFTFTEILEKLTSQEMMWGYHPWYIENNVITPLDSNWIKIEKNNNGTYTYTSQVSVNFPLVQENIVIFPNFTPYNSIVGISELKTCIDVANLGENAIALTNNILVGGGIPPGLLNANRDLKPEQIDVIDSKWRERYGGINKSGRPAILGPDLKYQKIGLSPSDFSALDITKITLDGVSIAFGVPKFFLMDTASVDYANSKSQERALYEITIQPKNNKFADRMTRFVLPLMNLKNQIFKFDWSQVEALQEDRLTKANADEVNLRIGKTYINELRKRDNEEDLPWGNQWWGSVLNSPLAQISNSGKSVSVSNPDSIPEILGKIYSFYKTKKITTEMKEKIWNRFVKKTEPQEKRLVKEVNKYFDDQEKSVLEKITGEKSVIKFSINDLLPDSWNDKLKKLLKPFTEAFMQQAGDDAVSEYGVGISFNLQDPKIQTWIDWKLENSALEINKVTRDAIQEAVKEGEGISDIADRIRSLFEETYKHRAETIARTEVISANNKASLEGMKQCGITTKSWLTAGDERVRETHAVLDEVTIGIDEKFNVGGYEADMPGDPNLPPEESINCRCTIYWNGEE